VYVTEDKRLVAVPFNDGVPGTPELLFRVNNLFDIDRFVMPPIRIVVNWWASRQQ
jgi:hypothetical protein